MDKVPPPLAGGVDKVPPSPRGRGLGGGGSRKEQLRSRFTHRRNKFTHPATDSPTPQSPPVKGGEAKNQANIGTLPVFRRYVNFDVTAQAYGRKSQVCEMYVVIQHKCNKK